MRDDHTKLTTSVGLTQAHPNDPDIKLVLGCDASPCVERAVLSHQLPDGLEKPNAFAS